MASSVSPVSQNANEKETGESHCQTGCSHKHKPKRLDSIHIDSVQAIHRFPSKLPEPLVSYLDFIGSKARTSILSSPVPKYHTKGWFERMLNKLVPSTAGSCRSCGQAAQTIGLSADEMAGAKSDHGGTGYEVIGESTWLAVFSMSIGALGALGAVFSGKMLWSTRKEVRNIARILKQQSKLQKTQRCFVRIKQVGLILGMIAGSLTAITSLAIVKGSTGPTLAMGSTVAIGCALGMVATHIVSQIYRYYSVCRIDTSSFGEALQYACDGQKRQAVVGGVVGGVFFGVIIISIVVSMPGITVPILVVSLFMHAVCNTAMQSATTHKINTVDVLSENGHHLNNQYKRHTFLKTIGMIECGVLARIIQYTQWIFGKMVQCGTVYRQSAKDSYCVFCAKRAASCLGQAQKQEIQALVDTIQEWDGFNNQKDLTLDAVSVVLVRIYEKYYYVKPSVTDVVYGRQAGELYQS